MKMKKQNRWTYLSAVAVLSLIAAGSAYASPTNQPPPAGAILDLAGLIIPHGAPELHTVSFTASVPDTDLTFALRDDPAYLSLSQVSMTDLTTSSGNLLINGDFTGGNHTSSGNTETPVGWTYANIYGAAAGGQGNFGFWYDGAVQAYDAISQRVATTPGDLYQISFYVTESSGSLLTFRDVSDNGNTTTSAGNGCDVLVYAQDGLPAAVPEPASVAILVVLGGGMMGWRRLRRWGT